MISQGGRRVVDMGRYVFFGLVFLGLTLVAGVANAGKSRAQFSVSLTVESRCSVTTSAGAATAVSPDRRPVRLANYPLAVDARCTHGGQVGVTLEHSGNSASVSPARGSLRHDAADAPGSNSASKTRHFLAQDTGGSEHAEPVIVTITF